MKIVDLKTFRSLPENTVFSKYAPCFFDDLQIKGETWEYDFVSQSIADAIECSGSDDFSSKLESAELTGKSLTMDFDSYGRDGLFDGDQLFAVWESNDVKALIERLTLCLPNTQVSHPDTAPNSQKNL